MPYAPQNNEEVVGPGTRICLTPYDIAVTLRRFSDGASILWESAEKAVGIGNELKLTFKGDPVVSWNIHFWRAALKGFVLGKLAKTAKATGASVSENRHECIQLGRGGNTIVPSSESVLLALLDDVTGNVDRWRGHKRCILGLGTNDRYG